MNVNWQYVALSVAALVLSVLLFWVTAGDGSPFSNAVAKEVAKQVLEDVASTSDASSPDLTGIRDDEEQLQSVNVHVDRSLSMQPYLTAREDSDFYQLIDRLGNFVDSRTSFRGFGFRSASDQEQTITEIAPVQLEQPATYTYKNNDYGGLLSRLPKDKATNLVITDGVQSDPKSGSRLGEVLEAIDQWIRNGGTFATLIHRTPYDGQYYSDAPGEDPRYSCPDRPLTTFALGQSPSAVDDLLDRFGNKLEPDHVIRLGNNPLLTAPAQRTVAQDGRRGKRVFRDREELFLDGYDQVYKADVVQSATDKNGFVPLQLQATFDMQAYPWSALDRDAIRSLLEGMEPEVRAYALDRSTIESINENSAERRASLAPSQSSGADEGDHSNLLEPASVQIQEMPDPVISLSEDSARVQFTLPTRKPDAGGRSSKYALLIRLGLSTEASRLLVPDSYTTNDDLDPSSCNEILNLRQLIGTIMYRNYMPGQMLLITEWY